MRRVVTAQQRPSASRPRHHARLQGERNAAIDRAIVVIALFALAANTLIGTVAAGIFIIAAIALIAINPREGLRDLLRYSPLLLIPLLAILSTAWSEAPQTTMRAAIQLFLTLIAAIIVYRRAEPRFVLLVLFLAFMALCLTAVPFIPSALIDGQALAGLYASKNSIGASAHLLLALGLAVALDGQQRRSARFAALCALPLSVGLLVLSQSATALASAGITAVLFPTLLLFGRTPLSGRVALFVTVALVLAAGLFFLPDISNAIADFRQNVLKKNATLTGRTYLWEYAARLTAEKPLLGHGYYSFWRQGNLDAEWLWRWGGIDNRMGFNFHNAFVEMKVGLGYVGQALLFATCAVFAAAGLFRHLVKPSMPLAFFLALQAVLYIRSYTETGLIAPFSLMTMLWIMAGICALSPPTGDQTAAKPATPPRPKRFQLPRDPMRA